MLVQLRPNAGHEAKPFLSETNDFLGFIRVHFRNALKKVQFVVHDAHVFDWHLPCGHHLNVTVQGFAAEDDAIVGFFWCHGRIVPDGRAGW